MASNGTTTDAPLADTTAERDAIRKALPDDVHVLTFHGGEPHVALVHRETPPSTEYPTDEEDIIIVDWVDGDDYALTLAEGVGTGWEVVDEVVSVHDTRADALDEAAAEFARMDE